MNVYGWSLPSFRQVLGSKDSAVLEKATALLSKTLPKEPGLSKAKAWLATLIERGFPLRQGRQPPSEGQDAFILWW
jgi:hypothetical protein